MLLWVVLAILAAASVVLVARPLLAGAPARGGGGPADIYRAQLAELQRSAAAGDIGPVEAEDSRREIARRLLAADAAGRAGGRPAWRGERTLGLGLAFATPLAALVLYLALGRPDLPGQPLASRDMDAAMRSASLEQIAESLFQRLAMDPDKPEGWVLLGQTYLRMERYADAAMAFGQAIAWLGDAATAGHYSAYGEALTLGAGGRVTPEAKEAFEKALTLDPKDAPSRFYLARAMAQAGDADGARAMLEALLADLPPDSAEHAAVAAAIADLDRPAIAEDPAIRAMVDGLAARLAENPKDLEGWLLLMTSHVRLGEQDKARAALAKARETFAGDEAALAAIEAKARELGLI